MTKLAKQVPVSEGFSTDGVRYRLFQVRLERLNHDCGPDCLCWGEKDRDHHSEARVQMVYKTLEH